MEQLINNMLANAQLPQIPQIGKKIETETAPKDDFQKLLEQKQSADTGSTPKAEKPSDTQKPQDPKDAQSTEKSQETEQPQEAGVDTETDKELEERMALAAMAMMQTVVVPVEQQAEVTPEAIVEAAPEIVAEEAGPLMAEAVLAPEEQSFAPEAETTTLEAAVEGGEDQAVDQALVEELPQTIEAPEAAQETEGRTVEIKVERGHTEVQDAEASETEETDESQGGEVETAVFEDVKAVPVKVGEAPKSQAAEKPVEEQITPKVTQALQNGETRVEIQLTPENLGKVTIEMTHTRDGGLVVQLHAENQETQNLLSKNSTHLAELLGRETAQEVRVEVPRQEESQRQDLYEQQQEHQRRQQQQQEQRRKHAASSEDFLQQLRLGLIPLDGE